ncbi:sugar phosphate isomerase/epimerase family protein [Geodermatophilus sp. SYSU D00815]
MKIGCHGLVWTGVYDPEGIRHAVRKTRDAGFDLIEFPLMDPFTFDVAAARAALDETGLEATGSLGLNESTDISSEDDAAVRAGEDLLNRAVDVLAELGAEHLCGIVYSAMRKYMEPATPRGVANSQAVIGRVAERAREAGIKVSVEVTNRYESNVLNTARQAREFVKGTDSANVGVHLDTYHMNIEESDMFSPVVETAEQLSYVHIGESHRGYLGTGSVDFGSFFRALHRVRYDGPVVFESFSSAVVAPDLSRMLGIWRNLWSDSDELGAHANAYIRGTLTAMASLEHH